MSEPKLSARKLTLIRRAAEDAIHACNRHYGPFVDVVAHPLNICALVDMAQTSIGQQGELNRLKDQMERAGYTDKGGELMKPPVGKQPRFDLLDELRVALKNLVQTYKHDAHDLSLIGDQDKARIYNDIANQLDHLLKGASQ